MSFSCSIVYKWDRYERHEVCYVTNSQRQLIQQCLLCGRYDPWPGKVWNSTGPPARIYSVMGYLLSMCCCLLKSKAKWKPSPALTLPFECTRRSPKNQVNGKYFLLTHFHSSYYSYRQTLIHLVLIQKERIPPAGNRLRIRFYKKS